MAERLAALEARIERTVEVIEGRRLTGALPVRSLDAVQRSLPGLTSGEAAWSARPGADRPVR